MADTPTATAETITPPATSRRPVRRERRGRGPRPVQTSTRSVAEQAVLQLRPSSIAPQSAIQPSQATELQLGPSQAGPRQGNAFRQAQKRRARGGQGRQEGENQTQAASAHSQPQNRRGGRGGAATQVAGRRQFGGQLTSDSSTNQPGLQADAAEFVPGQQHRPARRQNAKSKQPHQANTSGQRPRSGSIVKSVAEDLMTRTHEDIASGAYECMICSESVHRNSKIWSCHLCWNVLHLSCIRKWSGNESATVSSGRLPDGELPPPRQWRCPGCNLPQDNKPSSYTCWCGKETDPSSIPGLPPHSCGQSCGRERTRPRKCPHTCDLICHSGPCLPCSALGPELGCFCGKHSAQKRCSETNYDEGWSCGEICGETMPCGDPEHLCQRACHEGLCGACEVPLQGTCYCGGVEKSILCNDKEDEVVSKEGNGEWTGIFDCGNLCQRELDCGKHLCQSSCHGQGDGSHHCPLSTDVVLHCTCGKTSLTDLGVIRSSCEDTVPACEKTCDKTLSCGHSCEQTCHSGTCPPCLRRVDVECVCGRTSTKSFCLQGGDEKPQCPRLCRNTLNCGRHACDERCCSGEKKAVERMANKRRKRNINEGPRREEFEAEHICLRLCSRPLSCGNPDHTCQELCHKGKCNSCPNAIFDEVACHCGHTVLYPPLPCGTQAPPCRNQCQRPNPCGLHPQVAHNCHGDDEACPKCPFLVSKSCMCGKKTLKNQPCFKENVNCGLVCDNNLRCGDHTCRRTCHVPGQCEDAVKCTQACGKSKSKCGHPDLEPCHAPSSCKEDKPCQSKIVITCDCARVRAEMRCHASRLSGGNLTKKLTCDEECAKQARNRQLASALNVDPDEHSNDHVPYENTTLGLYQEFPKWAAEHEQKLRIFAADDKERRLRFPPMKKSHRGYIHALAEDFGFEAESLDPEPHRHVVIFKTPKFGSAPMKTIAESLRIRALQGKLRPAPATTDSAAASDSEAAAAIDERITFNGFVLNNPRFALTIDELQSSLAPVLKTNSMLAFDIAFLPSEAVVLRAKASSSTTTLAHEIVQSALKGMKASLATLVGEKKLAANVRLCALDNSFNLLRNEVDVSSSADGWSMVAAKGPARARTVFPASRGIGSKNGFLVLGKKKEKKVPELQKEVSVADDWEEEVRREEEAEQQALRDVSEREGDGPEDSA